MSAHSDLTAAVVAAQAEYIEFVNEDLIEDAAYQAKISVLEARVLELERERDEDPEPPPPPPPPVEAASTAFGACVLTTEQGVLTRLGPKAGVRRFYRPQDGMKAPTVPAGCSFFHVSWKPAQQPTIAQLIAACRPLRPGDGVTLHHELDVKHKQGLSTAELDRLLKMQSQFHADIVDLRKAGDIPEVETWLVHAAWRYSGGSESPERYLADADVLGPDLDGANSRTKQSFYLDWASPVFIENITRVADRDYDGKWGAPEYGERLIDSDDELATGTVGAKRLAAVREQVPKLVAAGARSVLWFDQESDPAWEGYPLTPIELPYWRELVATNV